MSDRARMLTAADFTAGVADRRSESRVPAQRVIRVMPCAARANWGFRDADLLDCSCRGLALLAREPMTVPEQFLVPLKLKKVEMLIYTVRSCQPCERGRFRIGAEFSGFTATACPEEPATILNALLRGEEEQSRPRERRPPPPRASHLPP
jgi:hypothetical protein